MLDKLANQLAIRIFLIKLWQFEYLNIFYALVAILILCMHVLKWILLDVLVERPKSWTFDNPKLKSKIHSN